MELPWSVLRTTINYKSSNVDITNRLRYANGNITSELIVIANTFNDFFINVGKNVTQTILRTMKLPMDYVRSSNEHSFFVMTNIPSGGIWH